MYIKQLIRVLPIVLVLGISNASAATIDFEAQLAGSQVNTIQAGGVDVTFSSNVSSFGLDLVTSSTLNTGNATTSGNHYLGVNDGGSELFLAGDRIDLDFSQAIDQLIVSFIAASNTPFGALEITNGLTSVFNTVPTDFLGLDEVFTLSILDGSAFTHASLIAAPGTLLAFNIDDISFAVANPSTPGSPSNPGSPVPAPPAFWLSATGLLGLLTNRRRMKQA